MKRIFINILLFIIALNFNNAQSFDSDRLPIGDINKKYDFCSVNLDKIFNTNTNRESSFDEMINDLRHKRIIMIGESHTNQLHHDVQFEVIKGLVESEKPVVLALEMFNPNQNDALAEWSSGNTDPNTFLEQTDFLTTWSHNYRYYKAIFDYAREKHIPIYGANIERKYASKINMGGLASLTDEDIIALPHIDTSTIEHKFLIKVLMEGMDAVMPQQFKNMYPAQSLWDAAMGIGAIEAAKKHPDAVVVVLAGSGHVVYNLGIGRTIKNNSNFPFASVVTVDIPQKTEESGMVKVKKDLEKEGEKKLTSETNTELMKTKSITKEENLTKQNPHALDVKNKIPNRIVIRSYGDYLIGKQEMKQEKYPSFGFSLKDFDNKEIWIDRAFPGTIAYENGFRKGDIILSIDDNSFDSLFEMKKYLHFKNWGEQISFKIKRADEYKDISFEIQPIEKEE